MSSREKIDFEAFYKQWYTKSLRFAMEYVRDVQDAENIVQEVFVNIYERRARLSSDINLTVYLFSAVKNRCINYLSNKLRQRTSRLSDSEQDYVDILSLRALEDFDVYFPDEESIGERLKEALDSLPPRCRRIFIMSKIDGKKQKDIAAELGISVNTVESQMAIAYRKLKVELKDCILILIFIWGVSR